MSTLTGDERHAVYFQLGPWLIGVCVDLLLQGIVSTQIANYFGWYRQDKRVFQMVVAFLGLLTLLKSAESFAIIWIQLMAHYGDLEGALRLNTTAWWEHNHPLMVASIGLYVQSYFCFRLWVISKKWLVVAPIAGLFVLAVFSVSEAMYFISDDEADKYVQWFTAYLSAIFAGNVLLSATTAYFLLKVKKNCHPRSVGFPSALVRLTFQTAAPATICAMLNLIFAQIYTGDDGIVATVFSMALPKLYAISMMWTLNGRSIGTQYNKHQGPSNASSELYLPDGGVSRPPRLSVDIDFQVAQGEKSGRETV